LQIVVTESGEVKTVAVRVPSSGQCAVIDTLRFTTGEETWCNTAGVQLVAFMRAFLDAEGFKVAMRGGLNVVEKKTADDLKVERVPFVYHPKYRTAD
jgi:hypothetical protein